MPYVLRYVYVLAVMGMVCLSSAQASEDAAYRFNEQGLEKLRKGDFEGAISDLKQAHIYVPSDDRIKKNLAVAYNNYAFHLMQKGDTRWAVEQYEHALYYDADNAYTLYNLGQAYYLMQNIPKAYESLSHAFALKPDLGGLKDLLEKVSQEKGLEKKFDRLETMHFIIASAPDLSVSNLSYIRTYLEEAYGRVGRMLDHYPDHKTVTVLYSEGNYGKLLGGRPHWTMALFDGKVRIPANKFQYGDEDVIKIIYHEYAHVLIYDIAKDNCPLWLNEGIASKAEDLVSRRDRSLYKNYVEHFGLLPLYKIPNNFNRIKDIRQATLMYAESYMAVDYMTRRLGQSGIQEILHLLGQGVDIRAAIERVFGETFLVFEQKWEQYLKDTFGISNVKYQ